MKHAHGIRSSAHGSSRTARFVVAIIGLTFLGTSRPLDWKDLRGRVVEVPEGVAAASAPAAYFGENVSNQGCFSAQRLDLVVALRLTNKRTAPIKVALDKAAVIVNGTQHPVRSASWQVGGQRFVEKLADLGIAPGQTATVRIHSSAFLAKSALAQVDRIDVVLPTNAGRTSIAFEAVRSAILHNGRSNANVWEAK